MGRATETVVKLYHPRPLQRALHQGRKRFNVVVAHRRFGKTLFCLNELMACAVICAREAPRYAYVAPLLNQAKDVAWDHLRRVASAIPETALHATELRADLPNGARIRLYGADNPDRLRGLYLDGVVLDEYGQMQPRVWPEVIRPALADRGGWAVFIGTPMGRNAFAALYEAAKLDPDWLAVLHRASETGIIPEAELAAAARAMSAEQYAQEFECSFDAAVQGAYYARLVTALESQGRIRAVPWEPALPVHTAWDLGIGDSTAIWFCQQLGHEVRLIDYYENSGVGLAHYAGRLAERPYAYGEHLLPHDAAVREVGSGQSRVETLRSLGIRPRLLPPARLEDGIEAARNLLPRCWFDAERCARGIDALRQYRRSYDARRQVFAERPLHDWTSHAADAFRYLAMGLRPPTAPLAPILYEDGWIV